MRDLDRRVVLGLHRSRHERRVLIAALESGVTALDTAYNYAAGASHALLAREIGDVLPEFELSTKVGFIPGEGHTLHPSRLRRALEQTNRDLGRAPDLVFLHNPERSLHGEEETRRAALSVACESLAHAASDGLCHSWGIASWHPDHWADLVDRTTPRPAVLMTRAGLMTDLDSLTAASRLAARWKLPREAVWGMSPFGGNAQHPAWAQIDVGRLFLDPDLQQSATLFQAAFAVAYHLPAVGSIAVGTDNPDHLTELREARNLAVSGTAICRYMELLKERT